ncbi:MAG TPA: alkaline phosphatase family protein [Verrucomicrobiae bacterium]
MLSFGMHAFAASIPSNSVNLVAYPVTNTWSFNASGSDLGTNWLQPGYDDTAWPIGRGAFGKSNGSLPQPLNTPLSLTGPSGARIITYYFRTHFNNPLTNTAVFLLSSNLIDDGAIFYLNGVEVSRYRLPGNVTATNYAQSSPNDGLTYEVTNWPTAQLLQGDNVVAVELHQGSPASTDIVFGQSLAFAPQTNTALRFLAQPQDVSVNEHQAVILAPALFGSGPAGLRWYKNGAAISGATNLLLSFPDAHGSNSGDYYLRATNTLNVITSRVAHVTVTPDTIPPTLISAIAYSPTAVQVQFSETIALASATNSTNYSFVPTIPIAGISSLATNLVLIQLGGSGVQSNALLKVNNIRDTAVPPNTISPGSSLPVTIAYDAAALTHPLTAIQTVFIIMFENQPWADVINSPDAVYIRSLLGSAAHAERYFSPPNLHPSLPNYLWLISGTNLGVYDDSNPSAHHFATHAHLPAQFDRAGISWKAYQENISGTNCPSVDAYPYAVRHDPFMYFDDVIANLAYCTNHIRPYSELQADLANDRVARFNFITPNVTNDMHDVLTGISQVKVGDNWLTQELPQILNSSAFSNNGAVFLVWDEDDYNAVQQPIGCILLSAFAKTGYSNTIYYTHSSTVRTIQEIFALRPFLADAANAPDLSDLFKVLQISSILPLANGQMQFTATNTVPGKTNVLQGSSNLVTWINLHTNVSTTNSVTLTDGQGGAYSNRFYRLLQKP